MLLFFTYSSSSVLEEAEKHACFLTNGRLVCFSPVSHVIAYWFCKPCMPTIPTSTGKLLRMASEPHAEQNARPYLFILKEDAIFEPLARSSNWAL
jgi:hypothetical protein